MSIPLGTALVGNFTFTKTGAPYNPSPAPTVVMRLLPDGTAPVSGTPTLTNTAPGAWQGTLFDAGETATEAGVYYALAYTTDTSGDSSYSALMWEVALGDTDSFSGAALVDIDFILSKVTLITAGPLSVYSPSYSTTAVTGLVPGDSYLAVPGQALWQTISWSGAWGNLSTATITLLATIGNGTPTEFPGESAGATSAYVPLTAAQSLMFNQGSTGGQLSVVYAGGAEQTLWKGQLVWSSNYRP